ncbi:lipopolysaccharide biosynthesis protein [Acinetobacter towneri]|uniref:lipopolysaccharide biosynthesis protein n=1 Tax=Acinetobacter towneri TaxID=202956 RepID=UPI001CE1402F|nr:lipopolysaccharide biosynthesis protein [Acinetobacter towneri]MCA4797971.1 lipopolysaccharide biosynthesis protein [Acinetobacter towneri]
MSNQINEDELKRKAVRGGALTISARIITILIQITSIIVLSRLLKPNDFGLIAMVTAITAFMVIFRDMGLSTAVIQKKDLKYEQINTLFWLNTVIGTFLTIITIFLAPFIAEFYNRPELKYVVMALASTFLIASVGAQHAALLQRDLNLKPKVIADIVGAILTLVTSISMAYYGYGFWSLACGTIIGALATTLLYFKGSSFTPTRPRIATGTLELIHFGKNVTLFEVLNYFHRNLDNVLIGKFFGAIALGLYSRAYELMMLPIASLRQPINTVALPVLSKLQNNPEEFKKYYNNITKLLAFLSMPLMAFLIVKADIVVEIALGEGWQRVVPIFQLLGLSGFIQAVASVRGVVLLSLGLSRRYVIWGLFNTTFVCLGFCLGIKWGVEGIAISYAIVNYGILYPSLYFFYKDTPVSPIDFFKPIMLPAIASIISGYMTFYVDSFLYFDLALINIIFSGFIFFVTFLMVVVLMPTGLDTLRSFKKLFKMVRA